MDAKYKTAWHRSIPRAKKDISRCLIRREDGFRTCDGNNLWIRSPIDFRSGAEMAYVAVTLASCGCK